MRKKQDQQTPPQRPEETPEGGPPCGPPPEGREDEAQCYCQGHRLMLIIGRKRDRTIGAVMNWALGSPHANTQHVVHIDGSRSRAPKWNYPEVPQEADGEMVFERLDPAGRGGGSTRYLDAFLETMSGCCFLEEVLIIAHGGTHGLFRGIGTKLSKIIGGRPIRKLVIFSCDSAKSFYPGFMGVSRKRFRQIAGLVAPRKCPCDCDLEKCSTVALNPDGQHPDGYRCPAPGESGKLLLGAWFEDEDRDGYYTAKLGFHPNHREHPGQPFTSPDGNMREITVGDTANGFNATTEVVDTPTIFGDLKVWADPNLMDEADDDDYFTNLDKREEDYEFSNVNAAEYTGPTSCPVHERGCVTD